MPSCGQTLSYDFPVSPEGSSPPAYACWLPGSYHTQPAHERGHIVIKDGYAFINEYKLDTCKIIEKLMALSSITDPEYTADIEFWLMFGDYEVDCPEKIEILKQMFSKSAVAAIYGSAGVGKSTLINHISHFLKIKRNCFLPRPIRQSTT